MRATDVGWQDRHRVMITMATLLPCLKCTIVSLQACVDKAWQMHGAYIRDMITVLQYEEGG